MIETYKFILEELEEGRNLVGLGCVEELEWLDEHNSKCSETLYCLVCAWHGRRFEQRIIHLKLIVEDIERIEKEIENASAQKVSATAPGPAN